MATTKMTRNGQVTIPIGIRELKGIREGQILTVEVVDEGILLRNPADEMWRSMEATWELFRSQPPLPQATPEEVDDIVAAATIEEYLETLEDA